MIKVLYGKKGMGKTKAMLDLGDANKAVGVISNITEV